MTSINVVGSYHTHMVIEIWSKLFDLVGELGMVEVLEMLLDDTRLLRRDTRALVLNSAIRHGQLDLVKCIFHPKRGPNDFIVSPARWGDPDQTVSEFLGGTSTIKEGLLQGMPRSSAVCFLLQLVASMRSCATPSHLVDIDLPCISDF
jgi:hypothetical protein